MSLLTYIPYFLLVFARMSAFFITAPIWMNRQIPAPFKWGFAFFCSVLVIGVMKPVQAMTMEADFIFLVLKETMVGLAIGFFAALLLYAVHLAGSMVDMQSGFAMATMFDPQMGFQEALTGRLYYMIAMLFFLSIDGHHLLIKGVLASYEWIPVEAWLLKGVSESLVFLSLDIMKNMFWIAFLIAIPLVGTLFLVDIALGILAKMVPQMNLFVVGIPIKMVVHFIALFVLMPSLFYVLSRLMNTMVHSIEQILKILSS